MAVKVKSCDVLKAAIPLKQPYVLSFATVADIFSVIIRITLDNGMVGLSEAVPLPGYSEESKETILSDCCSIVPKIIGLSLEEIYEKLQQDLQQSHFVRSAIYTSCEVAAGLVAMPLSLKLPLLAPISSSNDLNDIQKKVAGFYREGFRTIKLKTGKNIDFDLLTTEFLLNELPEGIKIRIDANQAYTFEEAASLLKKLDHPRNYLIELFEQPFGIDEDGWEMFSRLAPRSEHIPLMLDESIFSISDVTRAHNCGASFVKLKLFKHQGIQELLRMAQHAKELGVKVILGNGVSSDIGNLLEAIAFQESGLFYGAFEGNGFEKLVDTLLVNPLRIVDGDLVWENSAGDHVADMMKSELVDVVYNF